MIIRNEKNRMSLRKKDFSTCNIALTFEAGKTVYDFRCGINNVFLSFRIRSKEKGPKLI